MVGVAKAFEWFDGMVSDAGRQALTNQLKNAPSDERIASWTTVFPRLIDRVFGERAYSIRFFLRSGIASIIATAIVLLIRIRLHHAPIVDYDTLVGFLYIAFFSLGSNLIPDYCSLLISRAIVQMMERRPKPVAIGLLLALDTVLTGILGIISAALAATIVVIRDQGNVRAVFIEFRNGLFKHIVSLEWLHTTFGNYYFVNDLGMRLFFFSSLFTAVWVWLYVLSIVIIKLLHHVHAIWVRVTPYLDIEKKPLVAIGRVAGLLAGAGYSVILGFIWIGRHWH